MFGSEFSYAYYALIAVPAAPGLYYLACIFYSMNRVVHRLIDLYCTYFWLAITVYQLGAVQCDVKAVKL